MVEDRALVERLRGGDRDAWTVLVRRHAPRLSAYLGARLRRPSVVEKLVEDAVVMAFRHLDELADDESFAAWFRRVGAHVALRWYRDHRDEPLVEAFPVSAEVTETERADIVRLERALGAVTDGQRMALEQRYRGGLHGADLAEVLHVETARADRLVDEALAALERAWNRST